AEKRGGRADAKRQRENGDRGKAWRLAQQPSSIAYILNERFQKMRAGAFATFFLESFIAAEFDPGLPFGLGPRETRSLQVVRPMADVRPQLFVHLVFHLRASKYNRSGRAQKVERAHSSSGCGARWHLARGRPQEGHGFIAPPVAFARQSRRHPPAG